MVVGLFAWGVLQPRALRNVSASPASWAGSVYPLCESISASAMLRFAQRAAKAAALGAMGTTMAAGLYIAVDADRRSAFVRGTRILRYGTPIAWDYKTEFSRAEKEHPPESEEAKLIKSAVHRRSAERLLALCRANGGIFIKFAQAMSTNNFSMPPEYIEVLTAAQDQAQAKPWKDVAAVFEEDCGLHPTAVFSSIEEQPVAAASLAQVHRAVTKDGQAVAVKIQYPALRREALSDMAAITFFATVVELLFPQFGYSWLLPEFAVSLRNELNFLQEARNGERVAAMFASDPRVHVPAIRRELSTERVLVMEWADGVKISDVEGLKRDIGVRDPREVAAEFCRVMGQQYFVHGFVQADPHAGNFKVRRRPHADGTPNPRGDWQLVLLDHGMYRRTTSAFRHAFAQLYRGLLVGDEAASIDAVKRLGMKASNYEAMSLILVYRPPSRRSAALGGQLSRAEVERLKEAGKKIDAMEVNRFMQRLPRDMLFVLRSMNMVRSINLTLGGTSKERFIALGEAAVQGLALVRPPAPAAPGTVHIAQRSAVPTRDAQGADDSDEGSVLAEAQASALVSDVQGSFLDAVIGQPTAGPPAADGSSVASPPPGLVHAFVVWLKQLLGREPDRERLTYVNALARGTVINDPTDSERDAALLEEERQNHYLRYAWRRVGRSVGLATEMVHLKAVLTFYDLLWKAIMAFGGFEAYSDPKNPHQGKNPG